MPPRPRKTAATAPALEDAAPSADTEETPAEAPEQAPAAETTPAPDPAPTASVAAAPAAAQEPLAPDLEGEPLSAAAQAVAALIAAPAITYRWASMSGDGSAPCRACNPAGPPPGAGSFGCGHGQWVRVADEAA